MSLFLTIATASRFGIVRLYYHTVAQGLRKGEVWLLCLVIKLLNYGRRWKQTHDFPQHLIVNRLT